MGKGFGIAALVLAILSVFSLYGINFFVIWVAMICATIATLGGERSLTIASVVIAFAGLILFAPLTLGAILNEARLGDYWPFIFGFAPIGVPIFALVIGVGRHSRTDLKAANRFQKDERRI